MLSAPNGPLMLELALTPLPDWRQHRFVIGVLREHYEDLGGEGAIRRALGSHPEIVVFDDVTRGPAMTVFEIIRRAQIDGPIFIKDCDSWFESREDLFDNIVCTVDLRQAPATRNIPGKSFVQLNENNIVTGILEKIVCSNHISVGGYGVRSASLFASAYETVMRSHVEGEPFVSHVLFELIRQGEVFRGISVKNYEDVGTLEAWQEFRNRSSVYIVDLDGVIFRNAGAYIPPLWSEPDVPLIENVETVRTLLNSGAQIVFMTARPDSYRQKTEDALSALGLRWHAIIFGLHHTRRFLINDFAPSNPFPSAVAINLPRNEDKLGSML
ncbi:hypothetical protein [Methylobacterium sp. A52T]